jgi:ribonuclease PH
VITRADGRTPGELRTVAIDVGAQQAPAGSCVVTFGATRVLCAASYVEGAPRWRSRRGWVTAEYAMLPGSTAPRATRESTPRGRSQEIQRLIGRALRATVDIDALPDCTITVDCDVLQADGGTRTAAITGGWVALAVALDRLDLAAALTGQVAAASVGMVDGVAVCDLDYAEDVRADVDMNVVATVDGRLVEVQGTAEHDPFTRADLDALLDLATGACAELFAIQRAAIGT